MASSERVAIITGAGSGIGRAVALAFLADGYRTVLAGRRLPELEATAARAGDARPRALAIAADVTDPAAVERLFERTAETCGRLDVLFNNAGVSAPAVPLEELPVAEWERVIATNLTGAFLCTQQAFRLMQRQSPRGGRIINNGSISAHTPRRHSAPYTASKHAITGLTKSTALDGRDYDIACGQIDIGNARTELTDRFAAGSAAAEPLMGVEYVAAAVLQMANLPLTANVQFMTIMATKMPYIGRG
jgi:NAD(P)-dependent dehydrogenase (short-subunit alcohol dehydrogenase family)